MSESLEKEKQVAATPQQPWAVWLAQGEYMRKQVDNCDDVIFMAHRLGEEPDKWFIGMSKAQPERLAGLAVMVYDKAAEAGLLPPRTWGPNVKAPVPVSTPDPDPLLSNRRSISIPLTPEAMKALGNGGSCAVAPSVPTVNVPE